jgi:hypothetical protein
MTPTGGLVDAAHNQRAALADLQQARARSIAWRDGVRTGLDRQVLDPLEADGKRLLARLTDEAHALARLRQSLVR